MLYLPNQGMDFDQTFIDTMLRYDTIYRGKQADTLSKCQRSLQILCTGGASKAQVSLHTPVTVLPEPLLLLYIKYRSRERVR